MRIAFVHYPGRIARIDAARAGTAPTEFLFGAVELERAGHDVRHYEVDPREPASPLSRRAVDRLAGLGHLPPHLAATVLRQTRALLPELRDADVVVATTTGTAVALAAWRRGGLLRRPLVGIVAGLLNRPWRWTRRLTTLPLLHAMHAVLYGPGEEPGLVALDGRLRGRVHVVPFGVDTRFWTPGGTAATGEVLAIGNDGHRDWGTLVAAAERLAAPVRVLTRHPRPRRLPANVSWQEADWHEQLLSDREVRDRYRRAAAVAVPVRDVPQPSGQSVTLQAMACARPVVLTRTRGLWEPEALRDGENVVLVPPEDPDALAEALSGLLSDAERADAIGARAREQVVAGASVEVYARRLLAVCRIAAERG
ncbi:MAG TPA: glycosyltransferase family 4 protein [Gaiellaceae bacterium]|nr:glycosyltransferase family 4 protein [Gaiellaceae bacterium]